MLACVMTERRGVCVKGRRRDYRWGGWMGEGGGKLVMSVEESTGTLAEGWLRGMSCRGIDCAHW